jgi:hypothetical protein
VKGEQINGENMLMFPRTEVDRVLDEAGKRRKVLEKKEMEVCVFTIPLAEASVSSEA